MVRIGKLTIGRIDMEGGQFTYGNRIALGEIFSDTSKDAYRKLKDAFRELYGYSPTLLPIKCRVKALDAILDGFKEWIEKEKDMLAYKPTADEEKAGIRELTQKVGSLATIDALAEKYGKDPDDILKWDYAKVFGILFTDLEKHKYHRRFDAVINAKYSRHS